MKINMLVENENILGLPPEILYTIIGGVVGIILLIVIIILLNKFVFSRQKIKKTLANLTKDYQYLNNLLTKQDFTYIGKLDAISRTNLLYADVYNQYLDRYLELSNEFDKEIEEFLNALSVNLEDKNVKAFKKTFKEGIGHFNEYKKEVLALDEDLEVIIRPEEDCKRDSLMLKDKYREVKTLYESVTDRLDPVQEKFDIVFKNIDKKFNQFEDLVETADYDEAKAMLPSLAKILTEIKNVLEVLPTYLEEVNGNVPKEMGNILDKYHALELTKLPLGHLKIEDEIQKIKNVLIELRENFNSLNTKDADVRIKELHETLNRLDGQMDAEEKARNEFNDIYQDTINSYTDLEKNIIKLNNSIPSYEKYYIIDESNQIRLRQLGTDLDTLSKFKRRVDFYVHGAEATYYTDLLTKINDLSNGINDLKAHYEEYHTYLDSLKKTVDNGHEMINTRYLQLKRAEYIVRGFNNDYLSNKFQEGITRSYNIIDALHEVIITLPIDVIRVNDLTKQLDMVIIELLTDIDNLSSYYNLCIDNVTLINRDRMKFTDVHNLLMQAESLFFAGEYKSSYEMTETIIHRISDKDKVDR